VTPHPPTAPNRRVLVIFPGALGDLMCLMPALAAVAWRHPDASVELMARLELARLVAGRSMVARAHSIDAREVGALFTDDASGGARRFFGDFDRIYSFFASDDLRLREQLAAATDGEVSFHPFRPGGEGHVSDGYLHAIEAVDETAAAVNALLEPAADDLAAAARAIAQSGCAKSKLIVIFPGSGSPAKNWPAENFVALASMLSNSVAILGPAEAPIEPVFREAGVALLKNLDLPTVAAIARVAAAFVGNDSGASHLAAAVGASGAVIFGPTDPARWRPLALGAARIEVFRRDPLDSIEAWEVAGVVSKFVA